MATKSVFITHSVDEALYLGSKIVVLSPAPGKVKKILENRCFQLDNLRTRDEYYAMSMQLREIVSSKG